MGLFSSLIRLLPQVKCYFMHMKYFWPVLLIPALWSCSDDSSKSSSWCEGKTVAELQSMQGSNPNSYECATIEGKLVYRKSTLCRAGAYYLEDATGSMFVCDPSIRNAVPDSGVVICPSDITEYNPSHEDGFELAVKAEGLYYPAKNLCGGTVCWCQNGLEVEQVDEL